MSRARIHALAMVNWRGIFYERLLFDRAVTALEGTNGAGKTTVMVAVYVALFPDLGKLRFTNLGEHDSRSGDRGIYGRLGEGEWPAFTVLDLRVGRGERVLAGVRITRKTEPSVELDPFIVTGLSPSVPLRDVLLDTDDGGRDKLLDRTTLNARVARAGGEITWYNTTQYFRELYDRGVLPLRLGADEDRRRFNHMLRTSMIGGISHTLSGGLRDFVLREDAALADGLRSMRDNLSACQSTRRQIEEQERAELEVRGVYEAGATMFAAGVHHFRLTADQRTAQRAAAERAEVEAQEALVGVEIERTEAGEVLRRLLVLLEDAERHVAEATAHLQRLDEALARVGELERHRTEEAGKQALAEQADTAHRAAEAAHSLARDGLDRARRRADSLSHQLSDQGTAFAEISKRAGLYQHALGQLALLVPFADVSGEDTSRFARAEQSLQGRLAELTKAIYEAEAGLAQAAHHAAAYARLTGALEVAEAALTPNTRSTTDAYDRADRLLAELPGWRQQARDADRLAEESRRLAAQVTTQVRARAQAEAVLGTGVTGTDVHTAWEAAVEAERVAAAAAAEARAAETAARAHVGELEARRRSNAEEIPAWDGVAAVARQLAAASGAGLTSIADLDAAEDRWRLAESNANAEVVRHRASAEAARAEADTIERSGSGLDPRVIAVAGAVGGEPLATWYDGVALDAAAGVEALLGPLRDAIVVTDAAAAARKARSSAELPAEVLFVRSHPGESPPGEIADGMAIVGDAERARLTRVPERPVLGQAARQARIALLRSEAGEHDVQAANALSVATLHGRWLADGRRLRAEAARWLAPDPRAAVASLDTALVEARAALASATAARTTADEQHRAIVSLKARIEGLLPHLTLLDDTGLSDRAAAVATQAVAARHLRTALTTISSALEVLTSGIEPLRRPPLTTAGREALEASLGADREARRNVSSAADAANWLTEHAEALTWGAALAEERTAEELLVGLRAEHGVAELARERAEATERQTRGEEEQARTHQIARRGDHEQAVAWRIRIEAALSALGLGTPTAADRVTAAVELDQASLRLRDASLRRDQQTRLLGALDARQEKATAARTAAALATRTAIELEGPALTAWAGLQAAAERAGVLSDAYTESARARVEGRTIEGLAALAGVQRGILLDRLKSAGRGDLVRRALEERAVSETPRWADQVADWASVRHWLRERVPPQVSEADDPVRVLRDLALHLGSLRQQLAAREADLRVSSRSIANHLNQAIRAARALVDRLQEGLEGIHFGSIREIRVVADTIKPMARILDVLRSEALQTTLFDASPTLEQALERIYAQEAGGTIAGHRLLDYREYIELKVSVKRDTDQGWTDANGAKMSTGEAIGVGAALMMVVLDAWERRESLGRGKEQRASLRFLFLDEASRLSVDVLRTLFELCDRLQLQMLVAAPEVPLSEGNITWRLERVSGKVLVTGRKVEA